MGLQPHEYDEVIGAVAVHRPLREAGGTLAKAPCTTTPAGKRWVQLGLRMPGITDVYEHVTAAMKEKVREVLEERWRRSLHTLKETEREWIVETVPRLGEYYRAPGAKRAS